MSGSYPVAAVVVSVTRIGIVIRNLVLKVIRCVVPPEMLVR